MLNGLFLSIDHLKHLSHSPIYTHTHTCSGTRRHASGVAGNSNQRAFRLDDPLYLLSYSSPILIHDCLKQPKCSFLWEDVCWVSSPDCQILTLWAVTPNTEGWDSHQSSYHFSSMLHFVDLKGKLLGKKHFIPFLFSPLSTQFSFPV